MIHRVATSSSMYWDRINAAHAVKVPLGATPQSASRIKGSLYACTHLDARDIAHVIASPLVAPLMPNNFATPGKNLHLT